MNLNFEFSFLFRTAGAAHMVRAEASGGDDVMIVMMMMMMMMMTIIIRKAYPDPFFTRLMEQAYKEWREIERAQGVELIRQTGLLCLSEEKDNEHTSDVIKAFEATTGARFSTFYGKVE